MGERPSPLKEVTREAHVQVRPVEHLLRQLPKHIRVVRDAPLVNLQVTSGFGGGFCKGYKSKAELYDFLLDEFGHFTSLNINAAYTGAPLSWRIYSKASVRQGAKEWKTTTREEPA